MTTPTYSSGKYTPLFYPHLPGFYTLAPQNALNPYLTQPIPTFNNQAPYPYLLNSQSCFPAPQNYHFNVSISPGMTQGPQRLQQPTTNTPHHQAQIKN